MALWIVDSTSQARVHGGTAALSKLWSCHGPTTLEKRKWHRVGKTKRRRRRPYWVTKLKDHAAMAKINNAHDDTIDTEASILISVQIVTFHDD